MAGTTLRGIGDESDEETPPPEKEAASGPTVVDSAKVAESLRKLRSLEDRSGAHSLVGGTVGATVDNETTVPTPAADIAHAGLPLPGLPGAQHLGAGQSPAAGDTAPHAPDASRGNAKLAPVTGTLLGLPAAGQGITQHGMTPPGAPGGVAPMQISGTLLGVPASTLLGQPVEALLGQQPPAPQEVPSGADNSGGARGSKTLFGYSAPLPEDLAREAARQTNSRRLTPLAAGGGGVPDDFSGRDQRFFESEPINDLFEPEFPRPKTFAKVASALAAGSILLVIVLAYVRFSGSDEEADEETAAGAPAAAPEAPAAATSDPSVVPPASQPPAAAAVPAAPTATSAAPTAASTVPTSDDPALTGRPSPASIARPETADTPRVEPPRAEPARTGVAKLADKEPRPARTSRDATRPRSDADADVAKPLKTAATKPAAEKATPPAAKSGGFSQARTDSPSPVKPSRPATRPTSAASSPSKDSTARPMRITAPTAPGARTTSRPGGRVRVEDDPDATLPLSE